MEYIAYSNPDWITACIINDDNTCTITMATEVNGEDHMVYKLTTDEASRLAQDLSHLVCKARAIVDERRVV